jgi:hypothetical protein
MSLAFISPNADEIITQFLLRPTLLSVELRHHRRIYDTIGGITTPSVEMRHLRINLGYCPACLLLRRDETQSALKKS